METHELEAAKDYRLEKLQASDLYLTPADAGAEAAMDASWRKLTGRERGEPATLNHKGRSILVPQAALGVARFSFADLCAAPLGSLDYQRIAHTYHTLMVKEIPVLGPEQRNEARRLITLIDVLYDNGVGLIASAEAEPQALYRDGDGAESFARTASRLMEMRCRRTGLRGAMTLHESAIASNQRRKRYRPELAGNGRKPGRGKPWRAAGLR